MKNNKNFNINLQKLIHFRRILFIASLFVFQNVLSQDFNSDDWTWFSDENISYVKITKSETIELEHLKFIIEWDNKLNYSDNIGYYGGIKSIKIYYKNQLINTFSNIEDVIALGEIYMHICDYNMDGYLDFSIPIASGKTTWRGYYLYNPLLNRFENRKEWDYMNIGKINKKEKLILTHQDGNYEDNRKLYKINGLSLEEIKFR